MALDQSSFLRNHLLFPLLLLMTASFGIVWFNVDMRVEDYFYDLQGHSWAWKNSWLAERVFHRGGRSVSIFMAVVVLVLFASTFFLKSQASKRKPLLFLFLAVAGGSLLVTFFKVSLGISCPWEFSRYGGGLVYKNVLEQLHLRNGEGCFPAAHASAGYSWVALYFFGLFFQSRLRWMGLAIALLAGIAFGFAQQLRGAHFLSHDVWSLAVCWFFCLGLYVAFSSKFTGRYLDISVPVSA